MTTYEVNMLNAELSEEEEAMLRATDGKEPVPDEDCPVMTEEQYKRFSAMLAEKKAKGKTQIVSIRLHPETVEKAKALGAGYSGVLSRIVEYGLNNPEILEKCI